MKRQAITDGSGKWFDIDAAEQFDEDTWWDGSNNISRATGSQTEHEILYRTVGKKWILRSWSQWQGTRETWVCITDEEAAKWLIKNNHDHPDVAEEIKSLEIV